MIIYKLKGGLGNILFGLVELEYLNLYFNRLVNVDISGIEPRDESTDLLLTSILKRRFGKNPICNGKYSNSEVLNYDLSQFRPNANKRFKTNHAFCSELMDVELQSFKLKKDLCLTGWIPDLERIQKSNLIKRNYLKNAFGQSSLGSIPVALHFRLTDYVNSVHLGFGAVITKHYLKNSFDKLTISTAQVIEVFSDNPYLAETILRKWFPKRKFNFTQSLFTSSENIACLMSAKKLICSSSTFSFWAAFLSDGIVCWPKPYLYTFRKFDAKLIKPDWLVVKKHTLLLEKFLIFISTPALRRLINFFR